MTLGPRTAYGALIALQMLDVAVHVATGQVEPLRLLSNLVIGAGASAWVFVPALRGPTLLWASGAVYLGLNGLFLAREGLVNPTTEALRIPLFAFVLLSLLLLAWLRRARA